MKKKHEDRLLRIWKQRQQAAGLDVSGVHTLKEAEHFFDGQETPKPAKKPAEKSANKPARKGSGAKKP